MKFEVPQFIDVEEKVFGPFSFKQFVYLLGGAGLAYVFFKITPFPIWIFLSGGCIILGLLLAFYKMDNRPFIEIAQSYINFKLKGKLYVWKRTPVQIKPIEKIITPTPVVQQQKDVNLRQIENLARNLDILDS